MHQPDPPITVGALKTRPNLVPLPYRRVSVRQYAGPMTESAIRVCLLGHEAYRRTDFVVLASPRGEHAVAAVQRASSEPLFSEVVAVEVLALPDTCRFAAAPETDCANPSALAELARAHGVGKDGTLVAQGLYDHVNFIHRPDPIRLTIVEVAPPEPPKLYDLVKRVLAYAADLPPIRVTLERIDLIELARKAPAAEAYLVPCRSGGLDALGSKLHFLDERPPKREAWTLVGCERSLQFHRHYYGDEPPRVEMCPRRLAGARTELTMLKCCLLEHHSEREGSVVTVPWGTDLSMVEKALHDLVTLETGGAS
ncbi:MAG: hypothetical protein QOI41_1659 [Myxococcales bacterium]|nr:hypothetical protein [Myxococcales bacterium]